MSLPPLAQTALDSFSRPQGWEQRARLLMQWGDQLAPLSDEERTDDNLVHGCESKVWLTGEVSDDAWLFRAGSDARLIRGLVALLLARVNGLSERELAAVDLPDWFHQLGLARQLSPSRSNGLNAVLQKMRQLTQA
ncbi:SufE family protein [Pseudomonas syringae pv. aptata]|jgi:cysteine desulfuration protein SufE|uniref:Cysteine desulfuration protein SufE n=3 Tax=Pseudomonas syringae TaxID=317 RepID=A0AAQ1L6U5_PSESX|nr:MULTISPECIES: SufE family protein [Pseudomonas]EGH28269.1 Fe-S metabolism associated SufE [Pseudomonas syringae pv. japonica str. M301072]KEZ72884.1 Fe-S metabolism protein SufE [Pseudomonas syringae pv. syringae FF5]AKF52610.1 SufE protein probably involved in Fe-S centerassembly [Pseudomonas syringae pv. syringae HS191]ELQ03016.1 Fe-S metabolism associated SufE [Pseudomonas syringae BRIP34876]ELQ03199.1 Fe-S metabolism associated SufE [Pseudomonas syringae BRIP34881]